MIVINETFTDLLTGYLKAIEFENKFRQKIEEIFKLIAIKEYNHKIKEWEESIKELEEQSNLDYNRALNEWKINEEQFFSYKNKLSSEESVSRFLDLFLISLLIVFLFLYILYGLDNLVNFALITINCFLLLFIFGLYYIYQKVKIISLRNNKPVRLSKPDISQFKRPLPPKPDFEQFNKPAPAFVDMFLSGLQKSNLSSNDEDTYFGEFGEKLLLSKLKSCTNINSLVIYKMAIGPKADIDIILIDSTGIWILESKYFAGIVEYSEGTWRHFDNNLNEKIYDKPLQIHNQWLRQQYIVKKILRSLIKKYNWLDSIIKGGIVFTHLNCDINIKDCHVTCGRIDEWVTIIANSKPIPEFKFELQLKVADLLLNYHRKNKEFLDTRRAETLIEDIYSKLLNSVNSNIHF